jgi:hypothetical protein
VLVETVVVLTVVLLAVVLVVADTVVVVAVPGQMNWKLVVLSASAPTAFE